MNVTRHFGRILSVISYGNVSTYLNVKSIDVIP